MVCECKLGTVIDTYDLDREVDGSFNENLIARWKGKADFPETGLRPLADYINQQILSKVYLIEGVPEQTPSITEDYEALQEGKKAKRKLDKAEPGDLSDKKRTSLEAKVERQEKIISAMEAAGVDANEVLNSFISFSTVKRHLQDHLDAEKDFGWENRNRREALEHQEEMTAEEAERLLKRAEQVGEIPNASKANVKVSVYLRCPECATEVKYQSAFDRGYICEDHLGRGAMQSEESTELGETIQE